jgi:hypothetical protein
MSYVVACSLGWHLLMIVLVRKLLYHLHQSHQNVLCSCMLQMSSKCCLLTHFFRDSDIEIISNDAASVSNDIPWESSDHDKDKTQKGKRGKAHVQSPAASPTPQKYSRINKACATTAASASRAVASNA